MQLTFYIKNVHHNINCNPEEGKNSMSDDRKSFNK